MGSMGAEGRTGNGDLVGIVVVINPLFPFSCFASIDSVSEGVLATFCVSERLPGKPTIACSPCTIFPLADLNEGTSVILACSPPTASHGIQTL